MTALRMRESKFGAPAGVYVGRFLGVKPMADDKPRIGQNGQPMPPGMEWQFEVLEGEYAGQIVGRISSREPTTRNVCGQLLGGLVGRTIQTDEEIDPDLFVGQTYQVIVSPTKNDPAATYVTQIVRAKPGPGGGRAAPAPAPASAPTRSPTPPPAAGKPKPPPPGKPANGGPAAPPAEPKDTTPYWVARDGDWVEMQAHAITEEIKQGSLASDVAVMAQDGKNEQRTAKDFQLDIPF